MSLDRYLAYIEDKNDSDRFEWILIIFVFSSVFSCIAGTYLSYHLDVSTGGAFVVFLTFLFILVTIFDPKVWDISSKMATTNSPN